MNSTVNGVSYTLTIRGTLLKHPDLFNDCKATISTYDGCLYTKI